MGTIMDGLFFFVVMAVSIPAAKPAMSDVPLNFYFVEWRAAVKGRFCPGVARFCPVVSWFLSPSGPDFVPMWPKLRLALCEPVRKLTADFRMKIDDDSGAVEPVIAQMQCTRPGLAREPDGDIIYDSGSADQVQSVPELRQK